MSETARLLLVHGIAAAKAGDSAEAHLYLERVLITDATTGQKIRAWEYLARIESDPVRKRNYLENILAHDISNPFARREMAILNGQLNPLNMVDATHFAAQSEEIRGATEISSAKFGEIPTDARAVDAKRFICPQCGGVLAHEPETGRLTCRYCGYSPETIVNEMPLTEQDFAVALATDKGHSRPVTTKTFHCEGCGAPFLAGASVLAMRCPYCHSPQVMEDVGAKNLIPPEGIIPLKITSETAKQTFLNWLKRARLLKSCTVAPLMAVYLPVWTFDVSGNLVGRVRATHTLNKPVFYDDVCVPASRRLPADLRRWVDTLSLDEVVPFDERFLADWLADIYEISPSDASLVARKKVWEKEGRAFKEGLMAEYYDVSDNSATVSITVNSAGLRVEAFKLILASVWIAKYRCDSRVYLAVINGSNGNITAQTPPGAIKRWLRGLFG